MEIEAINSKANELVSFSAQFMGENPLLLGEGDKQRIREMIEELQALAANG